ncbi:MULTISPECIES: energy transducer TonB family protein [Sphingomonas]|uniref:energy transducer TonB family protein n=1 Tax=Sphingomonas TaxID=13687 RepID=UPI00126A5E58|nr:MULTISPECIES: energy transducer TonB [Sphingomonas]
MLLLLLAQAAASVWPPNRFPETAGLLSSLDPPPSFVNGDAAVRVTYTRTTVRDDGTVEGCVSEKSSGDAKLDAYACAAISRRLKFTAARWLDGTPAYSVFSAPLLWMNGTRLPDPRRAVAPDLELSVQRLPAGFPGFINLLLEVAVSAKGAIVACRARESRQPSAAIALVPTACAQATSQLRLQPPLDRSGQPVRSIQLARVRFLVGS